MKDKILLLFTLMTVTTVQMVFAGSLTPAEIERVKGSVQIVQEVDRKPLHQIIEDLEKTGHPRTFLHMREAMAKTYADIVREQDVQGQGKREWLYSMISLNMAYLQFVGTKGKRKTDTGLDMLICSKLKEYLPSDIDSQPGFHQSVDQ